MRRIPVDGLPVVRRALVLLSPGIRLDAQVHVLVHLHGHNAGYLGTAPRDLAADKDRIEEQLVAAGRPQLVLVLPQGGPGRQLRRGREPRPARVRARGARAGQQAAAAARRRPALGALGRRLRDQDDPRRPGPAAHALRRGLVRRRPGEVAREVDRPGRAREGADQRADHRRARPARRRVTDAAAVLRFGFRFRLYYQRSGSYDGAASDVQGYLQALFGEAGAAAPAGPDGGSRARSPRCPKPRARRCASATRSCRSTSAPTGPRARRRPATTTWSARARCSRRSARCPTARRWRARRSRGCPPARSRAPRRGPRAPAGRARRPDGAADRRDRRPRPRRRDPAGRPDAAAPRRHPHRPDRPRRERRAERRLRRVGAPGAGARRARARPVDRRERERPDPDARGRVHPGRGPLGDRPAAAGPRHALPRHALAPARLPRSRRRRGGRAERGRGHRPGGRAGGPAAGAAPQPGRRERGHPRRDDRRPLGADRAPTCRRSRARGATGCSPRRRASSTA